jgi:hypothetical protein
VSRVDVEALEALRAAASKASPGAWTVGPGAEFDSDACQDASVRCEGDGARTWRVAWADSDEAAFIAAAHANLPALLAEVKALREVAGLASEFIHEVAGERLGVVGSDSMPLAVRLHSALVRAAEVRS